MEWVPFPIPLHDPNALAEGESWIKAWRSRVVCVTLLPLTVLLCLLVVRHCMLRGEVPWFNLGGVVLLTLVAWLSKRRPEWMRALCWIVLTTVLAMAFQALYPWGKGPISSTHLLLPALILYGAVLGDLWITAVTAAVLFLSYGVTWWHYRPLSRLDAEHLSNLFFLTLAFCLLAVGVWFQYRRFFTTLRRQATDLQRHLEANQRLNAVLSHDISNPLCALQTTVELAQSEGQIGTDDLATVGRMAERIAAIVGSVRQIHADTDHQLERHPVTVRTLTDELAEIFARRMADKGQRLVLADGDTLQVATDARMLCCSVLGNLLSNAIKFSPRNATITLAARGCGERVRIELHNPGAGFPADVLRLVMEGRSPGSRPGTESETGAGYGLRIARFYLQRMDGLLETANEPCGAVATVVLPAAAGR